MHYPAFVVTGVCLLTACGMEGAIGKLLPFYICVVIYAGGFNEKWKQEMIACRDWGNARMLYNLGAYDSANEAYREIYPQLNDRGTFLFEYGHSLHKSDSNDVSNLYLELAARYNADPMILNVIGKNYQEMQCYEKAEAYFWRSVHRLPGRIYPYYLLAKLYAEPEYRNKEKFEEMKEMVLKKEPKVYSTAIKEMRKEIEEIAKRLK